MGSAARFSVAGVACCCSYTDLVCKGTPSRSAERGPHLVPVLGLQVVRQDKVEQRPELGQVVLRRRAGEQQPVARLRG